MPDSDHLDTEQITTALGISRWSLAYHASRSGITPEQLIIRGKVRNFYSRAQVDQLKADLFERGFKARGPRRAAPAPAAQP